MLSSEIVFATLLINGISFKSPLDDEFHTFRWEEYLRSTGTIAAPSHLFETVSTTKYLICLSATFPYVYVDNTIKKNAIDGLFSCGVDNLVELCRG